MNCTMESYVEVDCIYTDPYGNHDTRFAKLDYDPATRALIYDNNGPLGPISFRPTLDTDHGRNILLHWFKGLVYRKLNGTIFFYL